MPFLASKAAANKLKRIDWKKSFDKRHKQDSRLHFQLFAFFFTENKLLEILLQTFV